MPCKKESFLKIAYYISAHGFGHAARQQAIVHILAQKGAAVYIRSAAPAKFFPLAVSHHPAAYDVGMIQPQVMEVDPVATFAAYAHLIEQYPRLIREEVAFLHEQAIELVVTDMPPIASDIAAAAGIPSVAITHFTWDWVYAHYLEALPQYSFIVDHIRASYQRIRLALQIQIPLPHEFTQFTQVEPIAGVGNALTRTATEVRAEFAVPDGHRLGLLSMGGHDWGSTDIRALAHLPNWTFLVAASAYAQVRDLPQFRCVSAGYPGFHHLIAAADVLVGKAGGTTVAEVIKHRTPFIYTLNNQWRENSLLEATLRRYAQAYSLPKTAFERGEWVDLLEIIAHENFIWPDVPMNGAEQAAARLFDLK
jgi:hypothetical protein